VGKIRYADLTPGDLEAWKQRLRNRPKDPVKISVINKTIGALKTVIGEEVNQGRLTHNPIMGIGLIATEEAERGYFTLEELYRMFVSEAPECWRSKNPKHKSQHGRVGPETAHLMALFHFLTGERMAAILELRWQAIEFGAGVVTYRRTKTQTGRTAPLPDTLITALRDHADRSIRIAPGDYIFSYDSGEPIGYTLFRTRYDNMKEALKLPEWDPDGYRRTPYSLKVSLETHLLDAGADPLHVREYMGHSHGSGEKRLTRVQARYKRRRVEVIRERVIPLVEGLLSDIRIDK
jgi:integrase